MFITYDIYKTVTCSDSSLAIFKLININVLQSNILRVTPLPIALGQLCYMFYTFVLHEIACTMQMFPRKVGSYLHVDTA